MLRGRENVFTFILIASSKVAENTTSLLYKDVVLQATGKSLLIKKLNSMFDQNDAKSKRQDRRQLDRSSSHVMS